MVSAELGLAILQQSLVVDSKDFAGFPDLQPVSPANRVGEPVVMQGPSRGALPVLGSHTELVQEVLLVACSDLPLGECRSRLLSWALGQSGLWP